ncbi:MAG: DJ-1/PfpI family protein [Alistipes sp.]|nr:DJ-1/PfpI family protein [Alistipes sp.]
MKRAYILVADGFECVEALAPIDVMKRAGVELRRVAVGGNLDVWSSHGLVMLTCDMLIEDADLSDGDALILPGGNPGYVNLRNSELVRRAVADYYDGGRLVAAICGAPTVLATAGVARGSRITCHSSVVDEMVDYKYVGGSVIEDKNLITGAGAGVSVEFALTVAERLVDNDTLARVRRGMEVD